MLQRVVRYFFSFSFLTCCIKSSFNNCVLSESTDETSSSSSSQLSSSSSLAGSPSSLNWKLPFAVADLLEKSLTRSRSELALTYVITVPVKLLLQDPLFRCKMTRS
jgi:hypothetical protein